MDGTAGGTVGGTAGGTVGTVSGTRRHTGGTVPTHQGRDALGLHEIDELAVPEEMNRS